MALTKQQREASKALLAQLDTHEVEGRKVAEAFQELPPRKELPDYYKIISKPVSLELIKNRVKNGKYVAFKDFLRDLAQIFHNAKTYNMKKSIIYTDATKLEETLNEEIKKLKEAEVCDMETLPSVGNIQTASDDDEEDEDEVMEDAATSGGEDATDTPQAKKIKLNSKSDPSEPPAGDGRQSPSASRKRGRPPRVETPDETRMKNIVRAIKRVQKDGETIYEPFEKLPDAKEYPDYYEHIKNPMSIALVKKNLKRKVYSAAGIDVFLRDVRTIFSNAQMYNEDASELHTNATYMAEQVDEFIKNELARPDADYVNMDQEKYSAETGGMVKLVRKGVDKILQRGESYAIGDWIYIENTNEPSLPIIAQIFRTWQNSDGQYWINACWYYRPHQTVHRADKLWFEREVVKTGQYRDHSVQEILGHCYVMYVTKYVRGRPKEWTGAEEDLYVCEARYNEDLKIYNKIKAWKSCVPDESREQSSNYELIPYPEIKHFPKFRSPLLHLMPEDKSLWVTAIETEDKPLKAPEPNNRGSLNAPPIEGNVIITPIMSDEQLAEINGEHPAKEKTPEPPVIAPVPQVTAPAPTAPTPALTAPQQQNTGPIPAVTGNARSQAPSAAATPTPAPQAIQNLYASTPLPTRSPQFAQPHTPITNPPSQTGTTASNYRPANLQQQPTQRTTPRPSATTLPPMPANTNKINSLGSQINPTAFTFPNSLDLPQSIKDRFSCDDKGEMLWFTVPPQDPVTPFQKGRVVGHSIRYSAWRIEQKKAKGQNASTSVAADHEMEEEEEASKEGNKEEVVVMAEPGDVVMQES